MGISVFNFIELMEFFTFNTKREKYIYINTKTLIQREKKNQNENAFKSALGE
jgi:hypothetical protein